MTKNKTRQIPCRVCLVFQRLPFNFQLNNLAVDDIDLVDTLETATDGLWQAIIKINQAKVDPSNPNIRIRVSWTKADAGRTNAAAMQRVGSEPVGS